MIETTIPLPMLKMVGVFIGTVILVTAAIMAFEYFVPDVKVPNSISIVGYIVGSMQAGMFAARTTKQLPNAGEKLVFATWATAAAALLVIAFMWALFVYNGVPLTLMTLGTVVTGSVPDAAFLKFLPWILLIGIALNLLITYCGVGSGAKQQLKMLERQAAKGK